MRKYRVKEVFRTIQGEGAYAGAGAVFVRFVGCNLWNGEAADREKWSMRTGATCPIFCDTDFRADGSQSVTAHELAGWIAKARGERPRPDVVVFTGGEPLLQIDRELLDELRAFFGYALRFHVETNGTIDPGAEVRDRLSWITCSPKLSPSKLDLTEGDEIKVVWPAYDPLDFEDYAKGFRRRYVSAEAPVAGVGESTISRLRLRKAAEWVLRHPSWNLTVQMHKLIDLP